MWPLTSPKLYLPCAVWRRKPKILVMESRVWAASGDLMAKKGVVTSVWNLLTSFPAMGLRVCHTPSCPGVSGIGPCPVPALGVCCHGNHLGPGQGEAGSYSEQDGEGKVSQGDMWNEGLAARGPGNMVTRCSLLHLGMPGVGGGSLRNVKTTRS